VFYLCVLLRVVGVISESGVAAGFYVCSLVVFCNLMGVFVYKFTVLIQEILNSHLNDPTEVEV
jgi:hypothetical protein